MKDASKAACLFALSIALGYVCLMVLKPKPDSSKILHVETAPTLFHGTVRGIPCVESLGSVECFVAVGK